MNGKMETLENINLLSHSCYVFCWKELFGPELHESKDEGC